MIVRMVRQITGLRDGLRWPAAGGEIDLPDWEAKALVGNGDAKSAVGGGPSDDHGDSGGVAVTPSGEASTSSEGSPQRTRTRTRTRRS